MSTDERTAAKTSAREKAPLDDQAAETVRTPSETVAAANWHGVKAGAEIVQVSAQAAQRSIEQVATIFGLADGGEQVRDIARRNLNAIMQCNTAVADGGHEIVHIWTDAVRSGFLGGVENAERLLACRTPVELGAVQSDIMRQSMERMVQSSLRLSERSVLIARAAAERCRSAPF